MHRLSRVSVIFQQMRMRLDLVRCRGCEDFVGQCDIGRLHARLLRRKIDSEMHIRVAGQMSMPHSIAMAP